MALDITGLLDAVVSHAQSTGHFLGFNEHESKQSSTNGITGEVWVEKITPIRSSGLASTSVRIEFQLRIYANTAAEPYDDIDSGLTRALDALFTNYIGDFKMFGTARHIDVFGAHGQSLHVDTGYLNKNGRELRVFQIRLPVIIDDIWAQSA
jgi:hypothetical protein